MIRSRLQHALEALRFDTYASDRRGEAMTRFLPESCTHLSKCQELRNNGRIKNKRKGESGDDLGPTQSMARHLRVA